MSIVLLLYTSVYLGYQNKLLQNIDQFPAEYKAATVILDEYTDNDNLLFGFLDRAYDARKFTHATIYSLSERSESDLKAIIKKFPSNRLDFDLNKKKLAEICQSIRKDFSDTKTIVIANPDIAVRTANICNNLNVLVIPATIEDTDFLVYSVSFRIRLEELFNILFNRLENH